MSPALPLVSVGVPTYDRPGELRRCVEDLLAQTYPTLEIIVSDNGTGPEVDAIMRELMQKDARIRYFPQPENRGAIFNFQFVLDRAQGEYFMWAADDDHRAPTYVQTLLEEFQRRPDCAIVFCDFLEVDPEGRAAGGFPQHLPLLRPFSADSGLLRQVAYFFQLEPKGKANVIYGLMKRAALADLDWAGFIGKHGIYGIDMLFAFNMLRRGPLGLSDRQLYRCTVGNQKNTFAVAQARSFGQKAGAQLSVLARQLRYAWQYVRLADGIARVVLLVCWPLKALDIVLRLFVATELRNMCARWRRWQSR